MQRYNYIENLLSQLRPKSILEVGTWKGKRAIKMCKAAGCNKYIGFDMFEDATPETDKIELNVKPHFHINEVYKRLEEHAIEAILIKGNTRETLPEFVGLFSGKVDFAFIDGGHSVETIRSDWENVKKLMNPGGVVIFDDYYSNMPPGLDLEQYGANMIIDGIPNAKVIPSTDTIHGGGNTHLVEVKL
jgi:predicted O-methyltransferase YrrM